MSSSDKKRPSKEISSSGPKKKIVKKAAEKEYVKLPDDWIMVNGVVLYRKEDIDAVRSYMRNNLTVGGMKRDFNETRHFTMTAQFMTNLPVEVMAVVARNRVKAKYDEGLAAEKKAFATTFKRTEKRSVLKFDD